MTSETAASIHASAVLVSDQAVLIRGPSGSGKSRLAFDLILAGRAGQCAKARLIGDDRVRLIPQDGTLIVQNVPELAGLIEIRGLGIRKTDATSEAVVSVVVDLSASDAERLPPPEALKTIVSGVKLPRIPVAPGQNPLPLVLAFLTTT